MVMMAMLIMLAFCLFISNAKQTHTTTDYILK
jgi:hypothetical protein